MSEFDKYVALIVAATCLVYVTGLSEEMQEMANMLHNNCVQETGVGEDMIENARKGDFADDEKLKCYMKCLMMQTGCMDEEGILDIDAMVAMIPDEMRPMVEDTIKSCGTKIGSNHCENAWLTNKCYYEKNKDNYMLI